MSSIQDKPETQDKTGLLNIIPGQVLADPGPSDPVVPLSLNQDLLRNLSREQAREWMHGMLRIRRFEEKCAELYSAGKIRGFLHLYIGEEAVAVGVMQALTPADAVVTTYREHGHALARGLSMNAVMAEMYGKQEGCSRGRGGSMHIFDAAGHFYGGNAIVGGGLPLAVGLALADKLQGHKRVTACFFGDGAVAEGEFHEAMNLAALWQLPVLFCCENNYYAMGTALNLTQSQPDLHLKAESYRICAEVVDGMTLLAVAAAAQRAVATIQEQGGPYFLELRTYRFRGHSMFDSELWKAQDPIRRFLQQLEQQGLFNEAHLIALGSEVDAEVAAAVAFAEAGTWEPLADLCRDVYTEVPHV